MTTVGPSGEGGWKGYTVGAFKVLLHGRVESEGTETGSLFTPDTTVIEGVVSMTLAGGSGVLETGGGDGGGEGVANESLRRLNGDGMSSNVEGSEEKLGCGGMLLRPWSSHSLSNSPSEMLKTFCHVGPRRDAQR